MEVAEWNKMVPSLLLLSCEVSVAVKENPDRKKKSLMENFIFCAMIFFFKRLLILFKVLPVHFNKSLCTIQIHACFCTPNERSRFLTQ